MEFAKNVQQGHTEINKECAFKWTQTATIIKINQETVWIALVDIVLKMENALLSKNQITKEIHTARNGIDQNVPDALIDPF